jgi:hypothetical protein
VGVSRYPISVEGWKKTKMDAGVRQRKRAKHFSSVGKRGIERGERTNCAVETWRTATAQTVLAQRLDGPLLDEIVSGQTSKVVGSKVENSLAGCEEFGFGTSWAGDDWDGGEVGFFVCGQRGTERFGDPFVYELVNFLGRCELKSKGKGLMG